MHSARFLMHSARFLLIAAFATGIASAQTCDRACLKTTLDQYLNAVVKHDTSAAPLFVGFRQTDNGVVVRPGTGTWQSITALACNLLGDGLLRAVDATASRVVV